MTELSQDQLIRKEVALGVASELPLDQNYIWSSIAPLKPVQSDDVIFRYAKPQNEAMANARAEDAESELARKDDFFGTGRASIVDWAVRDGYSASDVSRYREYSRLMELTQGQSFPLVLGSMTEDWPAKVAADSVERRRKLERRMEWLTTQALETGVITYAGGNVQWSVDYLRPANQQDEQVASTVDWDSATGAHDPIGDIMAVVDFMWDTHDIEIGSVIMSKKAIRYMADATNFYVRTGLAAPAGVAPNDIGYAVPGFNQNTAQAIVEQYTGVKVIPYDARYRTRAEGATTWTNNRFISENKAIFLPKEESARELLGTELGFAKTMTSPHAEAGWGTGFYSWEKSSVDPWRYSIGTGIKAFPVFPALELSYTANLWTP